MTGDTLNRIDYEKFKSCNEHSSIIANKPRVSKKTCRWKSNSFLWFSYIDRGASCRQQRTNVTSGKYQ